MSPQSELIRQLTVRVEVLESSTQRLEKFLDEALELLRIQAGIIRELYKNKES